VVSEVLQCEYHWCSPVACFGACPWSDSFIMLSARWAPPTPRCLEAHGLYVAAINHLRHTPGWQFYSDILPTQTSHFLSWITCSNCQSTPKQTSRPIHLKTHRLMESLLPRTAATFYSKPTSGSSRTMITRVSPTPRSLSSSLMMVTGETDICRKSMVVRARKPASVTW